MKRWVRWAAGLYPAEWRARYGGEFDALLGDVRLQWSDLADVIRGAAIMRMTSSISYWKMALLAGLAGAVVAGGIAFAIADQYLCTASMVMEKSPGTTLQKAAMQVLSREKLIALIQDPQLDLYKKERQRLPVDRIAEDVFLRNVRLVPYSSSIKPDGQAFRILFRYPDRFKAKAVVERLTAEFREQVARTPDGPALSIEEAPFLPRRPIYPVRGSIVGVGAISGMLTGLLSLMIWRRTRTYAVLTMSIPKETKQFVDSQIAAGQYRSVSDYVRELIRADEQRHK